MMIERSKDESEKIGKYQSMLMSGVIAAVIVFLAPTLIVVILGMDNPDNLPADELLFEAPKTKITTVTGTCSDTTHTTKQTCEGANANWTETETTDEKSLLPGNFSTRIGGLFQLLLWIVRIVIVMMIIVSVIMLTIPPRDQKAIQYQTY